MKILACALLLASSAFAQSVKISRGDYLASKVPDAAQMCRNAIEATAKDPTSLQFDEQYHFGFGNALTRDWVYITWNIMGRNTYGAVLRHSMTCTFSCKQNKGGCTFAEQISDE